MSRCLVSGFMLLAWLLLPLLGRAQTVASYGFSQVTGATYTPITGGTVLGTATNDDNTFTALPIGFSFSYAGSSYTTVSVNANGWLRMGGTITSSYISLSTYTTAIAALNRDLQGTTANTSELRYQTIGTAPNQQLVVQWKGYRRYYSTSTNTDNLNFQIILSQTTNTVQFAYGSNVIGGSATNTTGMPQVGINGAALTDFNDRTSTTDWTATTAGAANTATITLSTAVVPPSGLVYTFTPPSPCTGTPTAGTAVASSTSLCVGASNTISLSGGSVSTGLSYQLQSSATSGGTYLNVGAASTSSSFTVTPTTPTYYRILTTCTSSSLFAASTPVLIAGPTYATVPYTQGFESTWISTCGTRDVPDQSWRMTPGADPDASFRRYDDGAAAGWSSTSYGYTPAGSNAGGASSAFSARYHSGNVFPVTEFALFDLYANMSGGTGTPTLTFDYINTSGADKIEVLLSTDGGQTFGAPLFTQVLAASWTTYSVPLTGATTTSVIRFRATGDNGSTDIGLDNVSLNYAVCSAVTSLAVGSLTPTTASVSFTAPSGGAGYTVTYTPTGGAATTVTPVPSASPVALTGLTPGTTYTISVTTNCTGGTTSTAATTTFTTPIPNDDPTGAIALTVDATCTPTSGTNATATTTTANGYANPGSCGAAFSPKDVWYSFTTAASQTGATLTVTGTPAGLVRVFSAPSSAGPFTQVSCAAGSTNNNVAPALVLSGLTPGTTYYISVAGYGSTDTQGSFTICLTPPPACTAPSGLTAGSITSTSASLSFTAGNGNTSYTVTYTPTGGAATTVTPAPTASPIVLTGLASSTTYAVSVVGNCTSGATTAATTTFTTACVAAPYATLPYTQTFEAAWTSVCATRDAPDASWRATPLTGNNAWRRYDDGASVWSGTSGSYSPAGSNAGGATSSFSARFHSFSASTGTTGQLDLYTNVSGGTGTPTLTFDYINTSGTDKLEVLLSTDGGQTFGATPLFSQVLAASWTTYSVPLTGATATSVIRFQATSDFGATDIGLDNVSVSFVGCSPPTAVAVPAASITATTAQVTFTASASSVTDYTVTTSPVTTQANATTSPITLTGLTPNTAYTVTLTTNCSGGAGSSTTTLPVSFTTAFVCPAPTYATLPYTQTFENTWVSACALRDVPSLNWKLTPGADPDASFRRYDDGAAAGWASTLYGYTPAGSNAGGASSTFSARYHSGNVSPATEFALFDLYANVSGGAGTPTLTFDYINTSGTDKLEVLLSTDGGQTFGATPLFSQVLAASWTTYTVPLSGATATSVIRFRATGDNGSSDIGLDNVGVSYVACPAVTSLIVGSITSTTASVSFAAPSGGASYTVSYLPAGGPATTITPTPTASPIALTGLTPGTLYGVSVTTNCAGGTTSATVTTSFTTPILNDDPTGAIALTVTATCTPTTGTNVTATTTTTNGYTNPGSCGAAFSPKDVWYSFTTAAGQTGATVTVTGNPAGLVRVFSATSSAGPFTQVSCAAGSSNNTVAPALALTGLTPNTTYYISVAGYGSTDTQGSFTICVTLPPACLPPTGVAAGSITSTSANATFSGTGNGNTSFTATATPTVGSPVTATGTASPIALTGLTPGTAYSLVITGNCGAAGASTAASFTTLALPPANDDCANAVVLTSGGTCAPVSGTVAGATQSLAAITCGTFTSSATPVADVWYQFTATSTQHTISITGGFDGVLDVRTGASCATTNFGCSDATGNNETLNLGTTVGTTYYLRYYPYTANPATPTFTICVTHLTDLVVDGTNSPYTASGTYNNVTINNGGTANLSADLTVNGTLTINNGGTLNTAGNQVVGTGSFTLLAGGTLGIRSTAGITTGPATTGAIRNTGATRSFSTDASYVYNGTAAQVTGSGLPATVRNLTTTNANTVTLTAPVSVTQTVTVGGAGNLAQNGNALTLLSSSTGTALIVNSGTGIVSGSIGVAQRYIDGSLNSGAGYRHYSAPVSGSTVADLATSGFSPITNTTYNTSATPGLVTPFPTVFGYDQSRLASVTSNYSAFDKGWVSPAGTGTPLAIGQGYSVQIAANQLVDFAGTFTNGNQTVSLARNSGATAADAGWALVGNPYPAPIDWSLVTDGADRTGLDAAIYVFQSAGPYTGNYRSYANGVGGNPVVPMAQGFFVRVSTGQTSGSLNFKNSHRLTSPDATPFQRTVDTRPLVQLDLRGAGFTDAFYAYAEAGTTTRFDSQYDARKLPNSTGLNLASASPAGESLAIDGRPAFTAGTSIPLTVGVPAAGTYSLGAATLANLPAGLDAFLTDAATGQTVPLSQGSYTFSLTSAQAASLITGRFTLHFSARSVLATATGLTAADVSVYPNPAHESFTVTMPAVANATSVQAELLNALGQVVRKQSVALPTAGARFAVATADLATGVYILRLQAGSTTLTKRVVIN